jgi:hypothetical protein
MTRTSVETVRSGGGGSAATMTLEAEAAPRVVRKVRRFMAGKMGLSLSHAETECGDLLVTEL